MRPLVTKDLANSYGNVDSIPSPIDLKDVTYRYNCWSIKTDTVITLLVVQKMLFVIKAQLTLRVFVSDLSRLLIF